MAARTSYVQNRILFYDDRNGRIRFSDFCMVQTSVGACVECRQAERVPFDGPPGQVNLDDTFTRIDQLVPFDSRDPSAVTGRLHDINCFPMTQGYATV